MENMNHHSYKASDVQRKVLVFGTFDGLHKGHLDLLKQAREYGDYLVVVVGRNSSVKKVKSKTPKYSEDERLKMVSRLIYNRGSSYAGKPASGQEYLVNEALLGKDEHDPHHDSYDIIKEINPDVICLGYDQAQFLEKLKSELKKMNLNPEVKVLKPYKPEEYHSSLLNK